MSKKKYKKAIESFDKRILEHKEKQKTTTKPELIHYWGKRNKQIRERKEEKTKMALTHSSSTNSWKAGLKRMESQNR